MIYLAKCKNFIKPDRIQVYKTLDGWEASIIGEKHLLEEDIYSFEDLMNSLFLRYDSITVSKRKVDYKDKHIVLFYGKYYLLDDSGNFINTNFNNKNRLQFSNDGEIEQIAPILGPNGKSFPNYYEKAKPLHDNSILWYARDVDTGLWVCFDSRNPDIALSESDDPYTAIYEGLCKYHDAL